ncbi:hypothetical protein EUZ85_27405 [Hahella sp. KA22]|uniref:carboxylesterase family protein n=1 Tax=Hahella sp. KA22 TaxID=1628392 RepID=UPI000FDD42AF|nr:hypothetical protein [Hahella sp. KA22]AZZ94246.1 hypothetical protein ENC22_24820 [Hahella sp. KA22]QAY57620.1 hypothetical protein EUZ85_27405 [Hahella sp. KA22]
MKTLISLLLAATLFLTSAVYAALTPINGKMETPQTLNGFVHLPTDYDPQREEGYPLLISLHGLGECGDATVSNGDGTYSLNMQILNKVSGAGVPRMIRDGLWEASSPLIVLAPQLPAGGSGICGMHKSRYEQIYNHVVANYNVDRNRVYVTGYSQGGNGTYNVLRDRPDTIAAAAPVAAWYPQEFDCEAIHHIAVWAFHGDEDAVIGHNSGKNAVDKKLNGCGDPDYPPMYPAKLTSFAGVGHNSWDGAYGLKLNHTFKNSDGQVVDSKNYYLELAYDHNDPNVDAAGAYGGDGYYYHYNEFGRHVLFHWLLSFAKDAGAPPDPDPQPGEGDGLYLRLHGDYVQWDQFRLFESALWSGEFDLPAMGLDKLSLSFKTLNGVAPSQWYVQLWDTQVRKDLGVSLNDYLRVGPVWSTVDIPLADFAAQGVDLRHVQCVRLFFGASAQLDLGLDEVKFTGAGETLVFFGAQHQSSAYRANGALSVDLVSGEDSGG